MSTTSSIQHQSLLDIAIEKQGSIEAIFELALQNNTEIAGALAVGTEVVYSEAVNAEVANYFLEKAQSIATLQNYDTVTITGVFPAIFDSVAEINSNTIISQQHQNMLDIALAYYGTIEAVFDLALKNGNQVMQAPAPGSNFKMPVAIENKKAKDYLFKNNMRFATNSDLVSSLFENGLFEHGLFA